MKPSKIYLNGRFLTQSLTGVQRTAYEVVIALDGLIEEGVIDKQQYRFILIYPGKPDHLPKLKHIELLNKGVLKGNLWEQLELPVYTAGSLLVSMCTISSLLKRKQIVVVHDASFMVNPQFFSKLFRTWYRFAIPWLAKASRHMITVSEFSRQELIKHIKVATNKISVIPNAADHLLKVDSPEQVFRSKVDALKPFCLSVSSLSANKNFKGLSEAIDKIEFKVFKMVVAGGVSSTLSAAKPSESIHYLGYVKNEELKYLYSNASLFIFPSFYEGFGIPPIEAMICGCPVLASKTSSLPEVLGDAAEYCDPHDINDMAEKIKSLLNDPGKLEAMTAKGLQKASEYSWKKTALKFYEIITRHS
jgi:glycosyltransferase involved in cell wall biosynthesis